MGVEKNMVIWEVVGTNVKVGCWNQIVRVVHVKVVAPLKPIRDIQQTNYTNTRWVVGGSGCHCGQFVGGASSNKTNCHINLTLNVSDWDCN